MPVMALLNSFHGLTAFTQQQPSEADTVIAPFYRRLTEGEAAGRQGQSHGRDSGRLPRACVLCHPQHWMAWGKPSSLWGF